MKQLALLAALLASACSALPTESGQLSAGSRLTSSSRSPAEAWARLPQSAGPVLAVSEEITPRRHSQRIVYGGVGTLSGENAIVVALAGPDGAETTLLLPPREEEVAADIRRELPNVRMESNRVIETNAYGPFGIATGEAVGGISCVYAWQWIEGDRNPMTFKKNPISIRIRYCGKETVADLIDLVRAVTLSTNQAMAYSAVGNQSPGMALRGDALDIAASAVHRY